MLVRLGIENPDMQHGRHQEKRVILHGQDGKRRRHPVVSNNVELRLVLYEAIPDMHRRIGQPFVHPSPHLGQPLQHPRPVLREFRRWNIHEPEAILERKDRVLRLTVDVLNIH